VSEPGVDVQEPEQRRERKGGSGMFLQGAEKLANGGPSQKERAGRPMLKQPEKKKRGESNQGNDAMRSE